MVKVLAFCTVILVGACTADHPADGTGKCGDGVLNVGVNGTGEQCDDGNTVSGDGCSSSCQLEAAVCGNGKVETGEECDDGNTTSDDGCSSTCKKESKCGNGMVETGEQCDDGNTVAGDGCSATCQVEVRHTVSVGWTYKQVNNTVVACPAQVDTVDIVSQLIDAMGNNVGAAKVDPFDCNSPGAGITTPLPGGVYNVHVEMKNHAATTPYAVSLPARVDISTADKTSSATIFSDGGYVTYSWQLVKESDPTMPLTCADAGIGAGGGVHASITGTTTADIDFVCSDGGASTVLVDGSYSVTLNAFGNQHANFGTASAVPAIVAGPNQTTALGTIKIPITGI